MTSLLDIAPLAERVSVGGDSIVDVYGVSSAGFAQLWMRFPDIQKIFAGEIKDLSPERIAALLPPCVAAVIAAGTGDPGNPEVEKIAARLPVSTQIDLITAILKLTMPEGIGPFVQKINALGLAAPTSPSTTPPPSDTEDLGKATSTNSRRASKNSKPTDTLLPGLTPHAA